MQLSAHKLITISERALATGIVSIAAGVAVPAAVFAEPQIGATVSAAGGYASSPFNRSGGGQDSATAQVRFAPFIAIEGGRNTVLLDGSIEHTEYASHYDGRTNYRANALLDHAFDARTALTASLGFDSTVVSSSDGLISPIVDGSNPDLPPVLDPTLADAINQRRENYRSSVRLSHELSERDSIGLGVSGVATRSRSTGNLREYNYASVNGSYSRAISEHTRLGLQVTGSKTNYLRTREGDSETVSPQLTASVELDEHWSLDGAAGMTFGTTQGANGERNISAFSGSARLCNSSDRWSLCLAAARSVLPSSYSGTGIQTSAGLSGRYQLTEKDSLSGSVSYARSKRDQSLSTANVIDEYITSSASWSHRFTRRLSGYVSGGYSQSIGTGNGNRSNLSGTVGVAYSIGDVR